LLGSIAMVSLLLRLPEIWLRKFVQGYVFVIGGISFVSLIDFFLVPNLFGGLVAGGLQGPFRNTGQAGSFFGVHLAIVLAFVLGGVIPRTVLNAALVVAISLALLFTLKRASLVATSVGIFLLTARMAFSIRSSQRRLALAFAGLSLVASMGGLLMFGWAQEVVPDFDWRLGQKYNANILRQFSEGFFAENVNSTFAALSDNPLIGVGLDNVRGIYQYHEIHSTYLGVLAYGGLLGAIGYVLFIGVFVSTTYSESKSEPKNDWTMFLCIILPLLIGLLIGWAYTYHIRKREFWILVTFVVVAIHMSRNLRKVHKKNNERY
ncbi:MAG: O-antigen ligase family protein, partial [Anaerolineales bacterium]